MTFKVYYADGTTYAGDPFETPAADVLVIVEKDAEHGRRLTFSNDYYVWEMDRWTGVDLVGMLCYLMRLGPRRVLIGRTVLNETFRDVYMQADSDPDFPPRTAYGVFEKKL